MNTTNLSRARKIASLPDAALNAMIGPKVLDAILLDIAKLGVECYAASRRIECGFGDEPEEEDSERWDGMS